MNKRRRKMRRKKILGKMSQSTKKNLIVLLLNSTKKTINSKMQKMTEKANKGKNRTIKITKSKKRNNSWAITKLITSRTVRRKIWRRSKSKIRRRDKSKIRRKAISQRSQKTLKNQQSPFFNLGSQKATAKMKRKRTIKVTLLKNFHAYLNIQPLSNKKQFCSLLQKVRMMCSFIIGILFNN